MAPMTRISIDIRQKTYPARPPSGAHIAIHNLRIELAADEFVGIVGPSGCGKTTLLNILAGLDTHYEGAIEWGAPPHIGYVFQNPRLLPWRNVRENIELALPQGAGPGRVEHLLEAMGIAHVQKQYPQRLSLGMSRRVALARAFAIDPNLLLMDEPFVSLDAPTARRVRELLLAVWLERPHTVLFVTHDLREAIALADRLIFLSAPPTTVAQEVAVDIPRRQRGDPAQIEGFRERLIAGNPQLRKLI
jgi:NitT/TauT family transport system ATP-binding protein